MDETLVMFGGELKFMENGHLGGYLVRFGDATKTDLTGDFFTKDTDFDIQPGQKTPVYFHHRMPLPTRDGKELVIKKRIGDATLTVDAEGVLIDAILYNREQYERDIAKAHKSLGWSSGTAAHLVDREPVGKAYHIKSWPLGLDASLTPTPAEPRNSAISLKSLLDVTAPGHTAENGRTVSPTPGGATEQPTNGVKGLTDMDPELQKAVTETVASALKAHTDAQAAEAKAKADRQKEIQDAVAEERKKWEAELKTRRRGSYAYGGGRTAPEDRKDDFAGAMKAWVKTGDKGGFSDEFFKSDEDGNELLVIRPTEDEAKAISARQFAMKASNATDMNIGTAADGGNAVPTGFYPRIIARRDESDLATKLPLLNVPTSGGGNTFDIPVDNEADGEFVATSEAQDSDLDAPAIDKKQAVLVNYTKYTDVSYQLLRSTPTELEAFLADFVGRGWAKTRNNLLLTEVAASGTALATFASATAIAFGEPEKLVRNDDLANYLDEDGAVAWVGRSATHWAIKAIVGNPRQYGSDQGADGRSLLGYPFYYSQKAAAVAASAKSLYFGNWRYVAKAEGAALTFMRDPYTVAIKNQVRLLWHFEVDFVVTQAEAIGYAVHPSA